MKLLSAFNYHKITAAAREYSEFAAVYSLSKILQLMPLDRAADAFALLTKAVAKALGPYYRANNIARENISQVFPELTPAQIETMIMGMWDNFARLCVEYCHIETLIAEADQRIELHGAEILDQLRDDNKPALFFSAHMGNWEAANIAITRHGINLTKSYRAANNPKVKALIREQQLKVTPHLVAKGAHAARELLQAMKQGSHVMMLIDHKFVNGIAVPFFGRPAMTITELAKLALRFECPVVPIHTERLRGSHFKVVVEPPLTMPDKSLDRDQAVLDIMTKATQRVEQWILANGNLEVSQQWLWLHRRWLPADHKTQKL